LAFHSGREADHSSPSSDEVKEWVELYLHSPNAPSWHGAQLGGAQDVAGIGEKEMTIHNFVGKPQRKRQLERP
jgi:hypothetical protein